jgi:hypothetical protein
MLLLLQLRVQAQTVMPLLLQLRVQEQTVMLLLQVL